MQKKSGLGGAADIKSSMKLGLHGLAVYPLGTYCKDPGAKRSNPCSETSSSGLEPFKQHCDLGNCGSLIRREIIWEGLKSDQNPCAVEVQDGCTVRGVVDASRLAMSSTWNVLDFVPDSSHVYMQLPDDMGL